MPPCNNSCDCCKSEDALNFLLLHAKRRQWRTLFFLSGGVFWLMIYGVISFLLYILK
jgi:hypothetical protein